MPVVMVVVCAVAMLWGGGMMMHQKDHSGATQTVNVAVETNAEMAARGATMSTP